MDLACKPRIASFSSIFNLSKFRGRSGRLRCYQELRGVKRDGRARMPESFSGIASQ